MQMEQATDNEIQAEGGRVEWVVATSDTLFILPQGISKPAWS
jgi:hypothetical protein